MDTQVMPVSGPQPGYTPRISQERSLWDHQTQVPQAGNPRQPAPRPLPDSQRPPVRLRSVQERHEAFQRAAECLHDRHYEDNSIRLEAELRLAEFLLA